MVQWVYVNRTSKNPERRLELRVSASRGPWGTDSVASPFRVFPHCSTLLSRPQSAL